MNWLEAIAISKAKLARSINVMKDETVKTYTRSMHHCDIMIFNGPRLVAMRKADPCEYEGLNNWEPHE